MLLLFQAGNDLYGIQSTQIVEILPRATLQKTSHGSKYIAGLLHYRHRLVPVIDLCHLLHYQPSRSYLSTRIMMVNAAMPQHESLWVGLMAERVTKTLKLSDKTLHADRTWLDSKPDYLGGVILHQGRTIQPIDLKILLSQVRQDVLSVAKSDTPQLTPQL